MARETSIRRICKNSFKGVVYNLELESRGAEDDLFWVEQATGIVTHNCFPKDINNTISVMKKLDLDASLLEAAWEMNLRVRTDRDWEMSPSAVTEPIGKPLT